MFRTSNILKLFAILFNNSSYKNYFLENNNFEVRKIEDRIIEAYIGEYASGKSENAVNRAVELREQGRKVTLVDLDLVEPFYTLRPIKKQLEELGIDVVAWETRETMGLGEAGSIIKPAMKWVLRREHDIILDIGYGVEGAKTFNLIEGAAENKDLKIFAIVNTSRPLTASVEDIVEYIRGLGKVDGLINNTHLGDETDWEVIEEGAKIASEVSKELGIPVIYTAADEKLKDIGITTDKQGFPVKYIHRYMPLSFW